MTDAALTAIRERLETLGHQWRGTAWTCAADIRDLLTTIDALRARVGVLEEALMDAANELEFAAEGMATEANDDKTEYDAWMEAQRARAALTPTTKEAP